MTDKQQLITMLRDEFNRWEEVLARMSEPQIGAPLSPSDLSTKDVIAHLWAWQQRSIARLEAALDGTEPNFPQWPVFAEAEAQNDPTPVNGWIYESNRDRSWANVYSDWRDGFLRFLALAEAVPEEAYFGKGKYSWLAEWPLSRVLEGSFEHHHEDHLVPLLEWLHQHQDKQ